MGLHGCEWIPYHSWALQLTDASCCSNCLALFFFSFFFFKARLRRPVVHSTSITCSSAKNNLSKRLQRKAKENRQDFEVNSGMLEMSQGPEANHETTSARMKWQWPRLALPEFCFIQFLLNYMDLNCGPHKRSPVLLVNRIVTRLDLACLCVCNNSTSVAFIAQARVTVNRVKG